MTQPTHGVTFGPAEVQAKLGVRPDQIRDYLALVGDSADNVKGVPRAVRATGRGVCDGGVEGGDYRMSQPTLLHDIEPIRALTSLALLTTSAQKKYRACARAFYNEYELCYRSAFADPALRFGTLGHGGIEAWSIEAMRDPRDLAARLDAAIDAINNHPAGDAYDKPKAVALMAGYHAMWAEEDVEYLAVERQFDTPLLNPETGAASRTFRLGGKVDAIVRWRGELYVMEHKTSKEDIGPGSDYRERLTLDSQVSNYLVGARSLGFDVVGSLYDIIGKPGQRPSSIALTDEDGVKIVLDASGARARTKDGKKWRQTGDAATGLTLQSRPETPDEYGERIAAAITADPERYFQRPTPVVRMVDEEREAAFDLWQTAAQIRESRRLSAWPRNSNSCRAYGKTCAFLPVCLGTATLDDPTKFRKAEKVNEELSTEGDSK